MQLLFSENAMDVIFWNIPYGLRLPEYTILNIRNRCSIVDLRSVDGIDNDLIIYSPPSTFTIMSK